MQQDSSDQQDISEELHIAVDKMLAPFGKEGMRRGRTILSPNPFDTSKPNEHDSKAEFQRELDAVQESMSHIDAALNVLGNQKDNPEHLPMLERLMPIIDQKMRQGVSREDLSQSTQLVRRNVVEVGGYITAFLVMVDLSLALSTRYDELKEQEKKFWNIKHRAPDYYARTIALRLAKLFARKVGKRPTYGTVPDGDYPSTAYGRALEDVFKILGINQNVRTHAKWAVQQITDEDLSPPVNALPGMIGGLGGFPAHLSSDGIQKVTEALLKKGSGK